MPDIPTSAPQSATAGDSLVWVQRAGEYTPADGWALTVAFAGRDLSVAAVTVGGEHQVTITAAQTAALGAGAWPWIARATKGAERVTVASGTLTLAADPLGAQASATTHAERMLAAIESVIEGRATSDLSSYSVAGRSLTKLSPAELAQWRNYYRAEVAAERGGGSSLGRLLYSMA